MALAALAARRQKPARMGTGTGEARIGIHRREKQPDGTALLGENPLGPVDHEVRVIRVDDTSGRPIAVVFLLRLPHRDHGVRISAGRQTTSDLLV